MGMEIRFLVLLFAIPMIPAAGMYFFLRVRKKQLEGTVSEEERMLEPFFEANLADKIRVVMSVLLLGSLLIVIIYLVTTGLVEPWRSITVWGSVGLLFFIVLVYGIIFFQKTRIMYERLEVYVAPAVMYILSILFIVFLFRLEELSLPGSFNIEYITLTLFSIIALLAGVKLLLMANRSIYDKKAKAEEELNFASEVQQQFLQDRSVKSEYAAGFGTSIAARQVGGDFLYLETLEDESVVAAVGDVSGHSFGAGLIMSMLITMTEDYIQFRKSPAGLMEALNRKLLNQPKRNIFATMGCIRLDGDIAKIWNAGHMPMLKYSPPDGDLTKIKPPGFALGMTKKAEYSATDVPIKQGEILVLYSDGLVETRDEDGEIRGEDDFYSNVKTGLEKEVSCKKIAQSVLENIMADDYSDYPEDDLTLIVIRKK